jgi:hypothetical protein
MIKNNGEDHGVHVDELGGAQDHKGWSNELEAQPNEFDVVLESKTSTHQNSFRIDGNHQNTIVSRVDLGVAPLFLALGPCTLCEPNRAHPGVPCRP